MTLHSKMGRGKPVNILEALTLRNNPRKMALPDLKALAADCARGAYENYGGRHWDFLRLPMRGIQCIFDNHPYSKDPLARDEQMGILKSKLEERGIRILATGSYPADGPQAGYTQAVLILAFNRQRKLIRAVWDEAIRETQMRLFRATQQERRI
jgi:hypothetical protein